jgi:hypothetical protein
MFDFSRSPPPTLKTVVSSYDNPGDCRFQFDVTNKILLACFEGRLTDELAVKGYEETRKRGIQTDACVIVAEMSSVTACAAQPFVRLPVRDGRRCGGCSLKLMTEKQWNFV